MSIRLNARQRRPKVFFVSSSSLSVQKVQKSRSSRWCLRRLHFTCQTIVQFTSHLFLNQLMHIDLPLLQLLQQFHLKWKFVFCNKRKKKFSTRFWMMRFMHADILRMHRTLRYNTVYVYHRGGVDSPFVELLRAADHWLALVQHVFLLIQFLPSFYAPQPVVGVEE